MNGTELYGARKRLKLTQAQLGDKLGMTATWVGLMERGAQPVRPRTALAVSRLVDGDVDPATVNRLRLTLQLIASELSDSNTEKGKRLRDAALSALGEAK